MREGGGRRCICESVYGCKRVPDDTETKLKVGIVVWYPQAPVSGAGGKAPETVRGACSSRLGWGRVFPRGWDWRNREPLEVRGSKRGEVEWRQCDRSLLNLFKATPSLPWNCRRIVCANKISCTETARRPRATLCVFLRVRCWAWFLGGSKMMIWL